MTTNKLYMFIALLLTIFTLTSCMEKRTSDAKDTFNYWIGTNPTTDIELLNGQYWQSAHWTKEYIMYLKFKSTKVWWNEFLKQNHIPIDKDEWIIPSDAPSWFKPSNSSIRYGIKDDLDQGSRYFRDTITEISYIYEIQL